MNIENDSLPFLMFYFIKINKVKLSKKSFLKSLPKMNESTGFLFLIMFTDLN